MSQKEFPGYAAVLLDIAIDKPLDYGVPPLLLSAVRRGSRVAVPVRGKEQLGYVLAVKDAPDFSRVQAISRVTSDDELITEQLFELALWMSRYYCAPLRQVFKVLLPGSVRKDVEHKEQLFVMRAKTKEELAAHCIELRNKHPGQAAVLDVMLKVKKGILLTELLEASATSRSPVDSLAKKGLLLVDIVRVDRSPLINEEYFRSSPKSLSAEQQSALDKISATLRSGEFASHLLFGVTGSGKTEVYLQAIALALELGKGTIMLVPEIALTAQTIERFRSRFDNAIAILHHRLSDGERYDEWHRIRRGDARIAIGARSAIFCPVVNLGLIIVDEEHESSYKQNEEQPCYQARDVAVMRAKFAKAAVVLGSATPSLESFYNAEAGKYILSTLRHRPKNAQQPTISIVDMRQEYEKAQGFTNFSSLLIDKIKERQTNGEQTILFLNRRGYHTALFCPACQEAVRCPHCDLSLTYHRGEERLSCHLCAFSLAPPKECASCHGAAPMKFRGVGTEQIERAIHAILPELRTIRLDADTTKHKGSHQQLLRQFGNGKADVLIGTQMVAKGLHFPAVTLVGVLNSDSGLNIPDFRASETTFQLINQVSGRAGRGVLAGEVIIQTSLPDNSTIRHASKNSYEEFFNEELAVRRQFLYPPFSQLGKAVFSGEDEAATLRLAEQFCLAVQRQLSNAYEVNPVLPAAYAKVKDRFRFQFLVKGPQIRPIAAAFDHACRHTALSRGIKILIDINPSSTYF